MALSNLSGWNEEKETAPATACGASGKPEETPAVCGAADKGSSCGATEEKPAACGSACGAGDK